MRIITYNVHGCVGMDRRLSPERIADVIRRFNPDVVALQELDNRRARSGNLDQARVIAEILEMESHFHPARFIAGEEYGDAILSRYPMRLIQAQALPEVPRQILDERRGALWVELQYAGTSVQIMNTHLGLGRSERLRQAEELLGSEWLCAARSRGPVIVCGDFNSQAGGVVYRAITKRLRDAQCASRKGQRRNTFATKFPFLCIDHVFVTREFDVIQSEVPMTPLTRVASDHYPLVIDVSLSRP